MLKKLRQLRKHKYAGLVVNAAYLIGWVFAVERGVGLWYLLITSILMGIFFWKQMWYMMNKGSEWYQEFCYSTSRKINDRIFGKDR